MAAQGLEILGAKAKPAIPALVEALKNKLNHVRVYAACALGAIGPDAKIAIHLLSEAEKIRIFSSKPALRKPCMRSTVIEQRTLIIVFTGGLICGLWQVKLFYTFTPGFALGGQCRGRSRYDSV